MTTKRLPPLQWLHTYLAVISTGSFSAAAGELHMTQAAVSKQIRQLEHQFGEALFKRHARGVVPTVAGEAIRERVESAFSLLQDIDKETQRGSKVHVRCDVSYADAVLSWQLDSLNMVPSDFSLHISTFIWPDISHYTSHDIYILLDSGEIPGMKRTSLGSECSIMVASPRVFEKWATCKTGMTFLTRIGQEQAWQEWLQYHDSVNAMTEIGVLKKLVSDSSLVCKRAVLANQGIALMRYSQVCNEMEDGRLVRIDEYVTSKEDGFCMYEPTSARSDPALESVIKWIESCSQNVQSKAKQALKRKEQ